MRSDTFMFSLSVRLMAISDLYRLRMGLAVQPVDALLHQLVDLVNLNWSKNPKGKNTLLI